MTTFHRTLLPLFLLAIATHALSQERLKVGVVLSGGGAKGFAHIGVLKVIEEAGIHIDYIGGASMGAIVGGLYAAGWSAYELDSIMHATDLVTLLADPVPRETLPFFNKQYGEKYVFTLSVQNGKPSLPVALSNGQMVYNLLSQLTTHVADVHDFRELPIPFFCTGTDIENGEAVIFESGNLPLVMRASGAFPGLLAPVEVDGKLITDGGILNNFPAREMKERGVDIVIGVNVEDDLLEKSQLNSIEKIIMQISSFQLAKNSAIQYLHTDVLICPDTYGFTITSFEATDTLFSLGRQAALAVWDSLQHIAAQQMEAGPLSAIQVPSSTEKWQIDSVIITENEVFTQSNILRNFSTQLPGILSAEKLYKGITNLYSTSNYRFIDFHLQEQADERYHLYLNPIPSPGYDKLARVGVHFDDAYKSGVLLNATLKNIGVKNSIASLDLILGDEFRYNFHYFIERGAKPGFGINSRLHLIDFTFDLPASIILPDSLLIDNLVFDLADFSNEVYLNLLHENDYAAGIAGELKYYDFTSGQVTGTQGDLSDFQDQDWYFTGTAYYKKDSRDRRDFTTSGIEAHILARAILPVSFGSGKKDPGFNVDVHFEAAIPATNRLTLGFLMDAGFSWEANTAPFRYHIGGNNLNAINNFKSFWGLHFAQFAGTDLISASTFGQYRVFKNQYLTLRGSYGYLNQIFDEEDIYLNSYGISYGFDTLLGPIEFTYANSNKKDSFYFNLGYWF